MGAYRTSPDIPAAFKALADRLSALETSRGTPRYTMASRPDVTTVHGVIIYVSDAPAGSKFQGSDGTSWVSLG